jgi:hypothetical protein
MGATAAKISSRTGSDVFYMQGVPGHVESSMALIVWEDQLRLSVMWQLESGRDVP